MIANAEAAAEEMAAAAAAAMGEDPAGGGQEDGEKAKKFSGKALRHALGLSNFWGKKKTSKPPAPPKPICWSPNARSPLVSSTEPASGAWL